jgi:hypothetical protein
MLTSEQLLVAYLETIEEQVEPDKLQVRVLYLVKQVNYSMHRGASRASQAAGSQFSCFTRYSAYVSIRQHTSVKPDKLQFTQFSCFTSYSVYLLY